MFKPLLKNASFSDCIKSMWRNWVIPVGTVMLIFLLASFASKYIVALATLVASIVLLQVRQHYKHKVDTSMCFTTTSQVSMILLISFVAMVTLMWVLRDYQGNELNNQPFNPDIPYLTTLLIGIISSLFTGTVWALHINRRRMTRYRFTASGRTTNTMFRARMLNREAIFHTKLLCIISVIISIIGVVYYFSHYINTNLSVRDVTIYSIVPAIIYLITLLYLAVRYYSFYAYYCHNDFIELIDQGGRTMVRYLLLHDDMIFLVPRNFDSITRYDTPSSFTLPYRKRFVFYDAANLLREHAELRDGCSLEPIYETSDRANKTNAFHYFVFLNDKHAVMNTFPEGQWYTLGEVMQMYSESKFSIELISEIHRIYTVAMAYKTYDRNGRRLYKIKHYRPTFRIKDIPKWDVDYNDDTWLRVAVDNEDRSFFTLRRLWRRLLGFLHEDSVSEEYDTRNDV